MSSDFTDVQQSYGRCLRSGHFITRFYDILMDSHPAIRAAFETTDFGKQRRALRHGISHAILYGSGERLSERRVDEMADVHSREGRAPVKPEFYDHWMESLVQAVRECDPQATPGLEQRWRAALRPVISRFTQAY